MLHLCQKCVLLITADPTKPSRVGGGYVDNKMASFPIFSRDFINKNLPGPVVQHKTIELELTLCLLLQ